MLIVGFIGGALQDLRGLMCAVMRELLTSAGSSTPPGLPTRIHWAAGPPPPAAQALGTHCARPVSGRALVEVQWDVEKIRCTCTCTRTCDSLQLQRRPFAGAKDLMKLRPIPCGIFRCRSCPGFNLLRCALSCCRCGVT